MSATAAKPLRMIDLDGRNVAVAAADGGARYAEGWRLAERYATIAEGVTYRADAGQLAAEDAFVDVHVDEDGVALCDPAIRLDGIGFAPTDVLIVGYVGTICGECCNRACN